MAKLKKGLRNSHSSPNTNFYENQTVFVRLRFVLSSICPRLPNIFENYMCYTMKETFGTI